MKATFRKIIVATIVAGSFFSLGGVSQAVTFADLLVPGAVFVNGDKVFFNFRNASQSGDLAIPYNRIDVSAISEGADNGIAFQTGQWLLAGANKSYDFTFEFDVKGTLPGRVMKGSSLSFIGGYDGGGNSEIHEQVLDTNSNPLANSHVYLNMGGDDTYDVDDYGSLHNQVSVKKHFAMNTGASARDKMFVSHFDQIFKSEIVQIPEPTTASLFGVLVAGSLLIRRRLR